MLTRASNFGSLPSNTFTHKHGGVAAKRAACDTPLATASLAIERSSMMTNHNNEGHSKATVLRVRSNSTHSVVDYVPRGYNKFTHKNAQLW